MKATINITIKFVPATKDGFTETKAHYVGSIDSPVWIDGLNVSDTALVLPIVGLSLDEAEHMLIAAFKAANDLNNPADWDRYSDAHNVSIGRTTLVNFGEREEQRILNGDHLRAILENDQLDRATRRTREQAQFDVELAASGINVEMIRICLGYDDSVEVPDYRRYNSYTHKYETINRHRTFPRRKDGSFNWGGIKKAAEEVIRYKAADQIAAQAKKRIEDQTAALRDELGTTAVWVNTNGSIGISFNVMNDLVAENVIKALRELGVDLK